MNTKRIMISMILLCLILLNACASAPSTSMATEISSSTATSPIVAENIIKVNLNTASESDFLATVPDLGNRMVREFMEYRPYLSIRQFRQEIGKYVDDTQVAKYEQYVFVPIAMNDSDAETLQQIPGLSAEEAASLLSSRPFASADAFLTKLSEYVSADELETAKNYLGDN